MMFPNFYQDFLSLEGELTKYVEDLLTGRGRSQEVSVTRVIYLRLIANACYIVVRDKSEHV